MKRLILIFSLILLLTACGKQEALPPVAEEEPVITEQEQAPAEIPVEEVPIEIVTEEPAEEEGGEPVSYTTETLEGLVEDTVGYVFEIPTFEVEGAANIHTYYNELALHLESYAKETVFGETASRACVASVYGKVTSALLEGDALTVTYVFECDYSDAEELVTNTRTDTFSASTGVKVEN